MKKLYFTVIHCYEYDSRWLAFFVTDYKLTTERILSGMLRKGVNVEFQYTYIFNEKITKENKKFDTVIKKHCQFFKPNNFKKIEIVGSLNSTFSNEQDRTDFFIDKFRSKINNGNAYIAFPMYYMIDKNGQCTTLYYSNYISTM